jgi:hypothetical protein
VSMQLLLWRCVLALLSALGACVDRVCACAVLRDALPLSSAERIEVVRALLVILAGTGDGA